MTGSDPYLTYLAQVPLFSSCSTKELKKIARSANEVSIDAGRVLVEEGRIGKEAYVIAEGQAVVKRANRKIATIGPGDHFGELALLDGGPRTATVVAETPMTLLLIGQREFAGGSVCHPPRPRILRPSETAASAAAKSREIQKRGLRHQHEPVVWDCR